MIYLWGGSRWKKIKTKFCVKYDTENVYEDIPKWFREISHLQGVTLGGGRGLKTSLLFEVSFFFFF